jgi:hypothetical protein
LSLECIAAQNKTQNSNLSDKLFFEEENFAAITDTTQLSSKDEFKIEALSIVMYDTDVGLGYGAKAFLLNQLTMKESFDLILFNSTKGERWYRFVFSIPDFELRQQKIYPLSLDLTIDYDKMIKNSFFGVGSKSLFENREYYTK